MQESVCFLGDAARRTTPLCRWWPVLQRSIMHIHPGSNSAKSSTLSPGKALKVCSQPTNIYKEITHLYTQSRHRWWGFLLLQTSRMDVTTYSVSSRCPPQDTFRGDGWWQQCSFQGHQFFYGYAVKVFQIRPALCQENLWPVKDTW